MSKQSKWSGCMKWADKFLPIYRFDETSMVLEHSRHYLCKVVKRRIELWHMTSCPPLTIFDPALFTDLFEVSSSLTSATHRVISTSKYPKGCSGALTLDLLLTRIGDLDRLSALGFLWFRLFLRILCRLVRSSIATVALYRGLGGFPPFSRPRRDGLPRSWALPRRSCHQSG